MTKAKNVRSVTCWVTDAGHDRIYVTYQRPLPTEWRIYLRELEEGREWLKGNNRSSRRGAVVNESD